MPARNLVILILAAMVSMVCYRTATRNQYGGLLAQAIGEINDTFVRPVDDRELFEGAMDGMVRRLDPYSDYITPEELSAFQEDLDQKFGGIGIVVELNRDSGLLTVLSPLPDTPAAAAGMRAGDVILAIDGVSTEGFQIRDAVDLMRGDPGTALTVTIRHPGDEGAIDLELERAIIPVASVLGDVRNPDGTWQYQLESHPHLGYIRIVSFGEKTADEIRQTLQALRQQGIEGLILDLRGNGGGLLHAAIDVCDFFVDAGKIVSIRGRNKRDWRDHFATSKTTICPDLPVVVLVDGYSASASEIFAACLQDHRRAVVVGTRSWGKGTVQNVMPFEGGRSALKLTVATYWRPSEQNIHRHVDAKDEDPWGVSPNKGYEVKVDEETTTKIILQRRERDKVKIAEPDEPTDQTPAQGPPAESSENTDTPDPAEANPTESDPAETDPGTQLPDLTGFEDPQLQRAIEAIQELIQQRATSLPKAA